MYLNKILARHSFNKKSQLVSNEQKHKVNCRDTESRLVTNSLRASQKENLILLCTQTPDALLKPCIFLEEEWNIVSKTFHVKQLQY